MRSSAQLWKRRVAAIAVALSAIAWFTIRAASQEPAQQSFPSPNAAVQALVAALEKNDDNAVLAVLGPAAKELVDSGDEVADNAERTRFLERFNQKHAIAAVAPGKEILMVGSGMWPMPIPIVKAGDTWHFDSAAGKEEMLYRRIGTNEFGAISAVRGYVAAQRDYAAQGRDGQPAGIYADRLFSEPGRQNGLYWETKEGEPSSPAGPLLAEASSGGYAVNPAAPKSEDLAPKPYHGYFYRVLKAQGPAAPGGAMSYEVDGKLKRGFALVAYPAQYRNSGVMTFIVNQKGQVYQKDLGEQTSDLAKSMTEYNPDKTWSPVPSTVK